MATNDDGSILYFSSPIRQKGTKDPFYSKIFLWDAAKGVRVFTQVNDPGATDGCTTTNYYQLKTPQMSADGTVLAYTASRPGVRNARYCADAEPNQAVIGRFGQVLKLNGNVALSANGKYAVTTTAVALDDAFHVVTDLTTGVSTVVAGAFNGSPRRLTDDGTIVTPEPSAVVLTDRAGGTRVLLASNGAVDDAIIDHSGATVVYWTKLGPNTSAKLTAIDVKSGKETEIASGFYAGNPQFSSDGSTVFYYEIAGSTSQLFSVGIGGGNRRQVTNVPLGVGTMLVSGNGQVGFYLSSTAQLMRLDLVSGTSTELLAPTPLLTAAYRDWTQTTVAAVGSVIDLFGSGLASVKQSSFCGQPISPTLIQSNLRFQVGWDLAEGPCQAIVSSASPFEHGIDLQVQQLDPQFAYGAVVFHDGFQAPVTSGNPAKTGEMLVFYMTGLGPVDSAGRVAGGFQCQFDTIAGDLQYAGLAPGLTGFYQINVRVPGGTRTNPGLFCGWDIQHRASTPIWVN